MIAPRSVALLTKRRIQSVVTGPKKMTKRITESLSVRAIHSSASSVETLLRDLRELDTSSLCDAEKTMGNSGSGIKLMNNTIRPTNHLRNHTGAGMVMAGVARTVSFTEPNDFLPVMRALALEAKKDEVLVVDTLSSTRAVAGEIFANEARRKGLAGIVVDGPIRDTAYLDVNTNGEVDPMNESDNGHDTSVVMRMYATGVTPYSGTTQSPGEMQPPVVSCGGIDVRPGDIVVGDNDGVLVADADTFSKLVPVARKIQLIEKDLLVGIAIEDRTLASMTNLEDHVRLRLDGVPSNLEFRI